MSEKIRKLHLLVEKKLDKIITKDEEIEYLSLLEALEKRE